MKARDLAALVVLGAIWGSSFLFIRIAVPALGPFPLMGLRVALAALALAPFLLALGLAPEVRKRWRRFLVLGVVNAAIPFSLIGFGEITLTASLAAIINSTTVLFTALVARAWLGDPLTPAKLLGVFLGIGGVAALVGLDPLPLNGTVLLAVGASLLAAFAYAVGGTYVKKAFSGVAPVPMALGQQAMAAAVLLPLAAATLPREAPPSPALLSALTLGLLCTAAAYLIYFRLIARVGPTSTLTVTFLSPMFGTLFGVVLLDEPFGPGTLAGLCTILLSVALVTGVLPRKRKNKV